MNHWLRKTNPHLVKITEYEIQYCNEVRPHLTTPVKINNKKKYKLIIYS